TYMTSSTHVAEGYGDPDFVLTVPPVQYLKEYVFFADPTYPETNLVLVRARGDDQQFHDVMLEDRKSTRLNSSHVTSSYPVSWFSTPPTSDSFPTRRSSDLHLHDQLDARRGGLRRSGLRAHRAAGAVPEGVRLLRRSDVPRDQPRPRARPRRRPAVPRRDARLPRHRHRVAAGGRRLRVRARRPDDRQLRAGRQLLDGPPRDAEHRAVRPLGLGLGHAEHVLVHEERLVRLSRRHERRARQRRHHQLSPEPSRAICSAAARRDLIRWAAKRSTAPGAAAGGPHAARGRGPPQVQSRHP